MRFVTMLVLGFAVFLTSCSSGNDRCDGVLGEKRDEWETAVEEAKPCETDNDCGVVRVQPGFSACGNAVNKAEIEQLEIFDDMLVNELAECGITLTTPECEERPDPVCTANRCVFPPESSP